MKEVKVIIAGGRDFDNYQYLKDCCDYIVDILKVTAEEPIEIVIVSGAAKGADKLGERYASEKNYKVNRYPADWDTYGKSAGFRRNEVMAKNADVLIAFWDGTSKGTKHMIDLAGAYKLRVITRGYGEQND